MEDELLLAVAQWRCLRWGKMRRKGTEKQWPSPVWWAQRGMGLTGESTQ